ALDVLGRRFADWAIERFDEAEQTEQEEPTGDQSADGRGPPVERLVEIAGLGRAVVQARPYQHESDGQEDHPARRIADAPKPFYPDAPRGLIVEMMKER